MSSWEGEVLRTLDRIGAAAGDDPVDLLGQAFPLLVCRMVVGGWMAVGFHALRETFE